MNRQRGPKCFLCGEEGKLLYQIKETNRNSDRKWTYYFCQSCHHLWLYPVLKPEELRRAYEDYHTHTFPQAPLPAQPSRQKLVRAILFANLGYDYLRPKPGIVWRLVSKLAWLVPGLRHRASIAITGVKGKENGLLLDIGCGNGLYLQRMADLGWNVVGIEPDEKAAETSRRQFGLQVITCGIEEADLPESTYDAITLRHSLEHIANPESVFQKCFRLLRPGGRIYILTPNIRSLGRCFFREKWRGLEPPRHLHLFSLFSLQELLRRNGFEIVAAWTTARYAPFYFRESSQLRFKPGRTIAGRLFQLLESCLIIIKKGEGEEILVEGLKP